MGCETQCRLTLYWSRCLAGLCTSYSLQRLVGAVCSFALSRVGTDHTAALSLVFRSPPRSFLHNSVWFKERGRGGAGTRTRTGSSRRKLCMQLNKTGEGGFCWVSTKAQSGSWCLYGCTARRPESAGCSSQAACCFLIKDVIVITLSSMKYDRKQIPCFLIHGFENVLK